MRVPPKLLAPERRRSRTVQAAALTGGLVLGWLANPDRPLPFDVCALKLLTGVPCPTCGLTRAMCHALHGHWMESAVYHPAGVLAAAMLIGWIVWSIAEVTSGRPIGDRVRARLATVLLAAGAAISLVSWIVRLASGAWISV